MPGKYHSDELAADVAGAITATIGLRPTVAELCGSASAAGSWCHTQRRDAPIHPNLVSRSRCPPVRPLRPCGRRRGAADDTVACGAGGSGARYRRTHRAQPRRMPTVPRAQRNAGDDRRRRASADLEVFGPGPDSEGAYRAAFPDASPDAAVRAGAVRSDVPHARAASRRRPGGRQRPGAHVLTDLELAEQRRCARRMSRFRSATAVRHLRQTSGPAPARFRAARRGPRAVGADAHDLGSFRGDRRCCNGHNSTDPRVDEVAYWDRRRIDSIRRSSPSRLVGPAAGPDRFVGRGDGWHDHGDIAQIQVCLDTFEDQVARGTPG